jgi:fibro-slime domain-containing protein
MRRASLPALALLLSCSPDERSSAGTDDAAGPAPVDAGPDARTGSGFIDAAIVVPTADAAPQDCGGLLATFRDFTSTHPDFESGLGDDRGLVRPDLGADDKPVYLPGGATPTVSGAASFDQWYRDVPGVNMTFVQPLPLVEASDGLFVFDDTEFFPLDGMGFPDEVAGHNYHFTTEIHTAFRYNGGEKFTFRGDDDVFVFVDRKLVIDLGGVHTEQTQTIDFDAQAATLGLTIGETYDFSIFHAERHTSGSNFHIETTIECFVIP